MIQINIAKLLRICWQTFWVGTIPAAALLVNHLVQFDMFWSAMAPGQYGYPWLIIFFLAYTGFAIFMTCGPTYWWKSENESA